MKRLEFRFSFAVPLMIVMFGVMSCGSNSELTSVDGNISSSALSETSSVENLIHSKAYTGSLIIFVDEKLEPELSVDKELTTKKLESAPALAELQGILNRYPSAVLNYALTTKMIEGEEASNNTDASLGNRKERQFYRIEIENPEEAAQLFQELNRSAAITYISPTVIDAPSSMTLLTMHQGYLRVGSGLNAENAWRRGARGQDVIVVDHEHGMNFGHQDLGLNFSRFFPEADPNVPTGGNYTNDPECFPGHYERLDCLDWIRHGTAVSGIIAAKDVPGKEGGVTGLAPDVKFLAESMSASGAYEGLIVTSDDIYPPWNPNDMRYSVDTRNSAYDIEPGTIWLIEVQKAWVGSPTDCRIENGQPLCGPPCTPAEQQQGRCSRCSTQQANQLNCRACVGGPAQQLRCMPSPIEPIDFWAIHDAIEYWVTVITGAGNGSTNLEDLDTIASGSGRNYINFANADTGTRINGRLVENSGAIVVGATEGSNKLPTTWTNCGDRIDLFAWGQGVVTTGYNPSPPTSPETDQDWMSSMSPSPARPQQIDSYFVNTFGGTSSAAAMVAGAAALVQSYAKQRMGAPTRFLMPEKIKEFLITSGDAVLAYPDTSPCFTPANRVPRGRQPNVDVALNRVDTFLNGLSNGVNVAYQKVRQGQQLTMTEYDTLRGAGVGLVCWRQEPHRSDAACPEEKIWPRWRVARSLDFDGDGRADLVSWKHPSGAGQLGEWKLDLSSQENGVEARDSRNDNYGAWDKTLTYNAFQSKFVLPYVHDMNNDGRSDFVVYDKEFGRVYIAYMETSLLNASTQSLGWDEVLQYNWTDELELNPRQSRISRPLFEDYNGDGWIDIAIACSDGMWRIDHSDEGAFDGVWDLERNFLMLDHSPINRTDTFSADGVARQVPGWAYLPFTIGSRISPNNVTGTGYASTPPYVAFKIPDGISEAGRIVEYNLYDPDPYFDVMSNRPHHFDGNDFIPFQFYTGESSLDIGLRSTSSQTWDVFRVNDPQQNLNPLGPDNVYGGLDCRPVIADFDGDNFDDRAVSCPNEWRIVYSTDINQSSDDDVFTSQIGSDRVRRIGLGYDQNTLNLPGRPYVGGITYERVWELINYSLATNPTLEPVIPVDMTTYNACIGTNGCH